MNAQFPLGSVERREPPFLIESIQLFQCIFGGEWRSDKEVKDPIVSGFGVDHDIQRNLGARSEMFLDVIVSLPSLAQDSLVRCRRIIAYLATM